MGTPVQELFHELVDVPRRERKKILAQRRIPAHLCAEVESLLGHDSSAGKSLTGRISASVEEALRASNEPSLRYCGPYRVVRLLGSGGMGAVYLAERQDGEIEQKVAIKLLRAEADRPAWRERFLRERQFLASLNHPSIAHLLDAGHTSDGRPYLVMEHIEGTTIDEYAATLDLPARLKLFLLVCEGVTHAHQHLIIHRDLKPSNILVDSSGHPKLLDFGIARLLDVSHDETRTVERLLTPSYASPEQLRGDAQTTATDIYSLGAVLYKLLTGRSPREPFSDTPPLRYDMACDEDVTAASRLNPKLPRDIDYILRKALRHHPSERYASVDAFADDIRAVLEMRPVKARSGDVWYRTRKFMRRYRVAVAATTITIASLVIGLQVANHQRNIAQRRFVQVRQLANKVLVLDQVIGGLHSSTKARREIVAMSQEFLEALGAEDHANQDLALEIGEAYSLLARAQGISIAANLGQHAEAEESLRKAEVFVQPMLKKRPDSRKALLTAARISHDRMVLAEVGRRPEEAVSQARRSVEFLDKLLALGPLSEEESETASELYYNIALAHKNLHLTDDGIRYARRSIETSRSRPHGQRRASLAMSILADLLRITGDLEGALDAIREARASLEKAEFPNEMARRSSWFTVLLREGRILGAASGMSLNRPSEAIDVLQRAFDLVEAWTQNDRDDAWSRMFFAAVGRELGAILRQRDPQRALAIYDHSLMRLRQVRNNVEARRGEVELLTGSAYALRRLNRINDAKDRIDAAFRLLGETNDYPAERIVPHDAADEAFRALGDHLAETGQTSRAVDVYEDLLAKLTASNPDVRNDLRHALAVSQIYGSLAALHPRIGHHDRGEKLAALRLQVWNHWDRKLPSNPFVRRQIESARI